MICLQEVSITWAGDLHVFFLSRGYAFVAAHYGAYFNNYMGKTPTIFSSLAGGNWLRGQPRMPSKYLVQWFAML